MNNIDSLIIGIISGIFTAAVIQLLLLIFNRVLLPWYRQLIYSGIDISGTWTEELNFDNGNKQTLTAELNQNADSISGNIVLAKTKNGEHYKTEAMSLEGRLKDRLLNCVLKHTDKKRLGISTLLLEVVGDGKKMKGQTTWYDAGKATIFSKDTKWIRK
jgi:hypothetical protein